MSADIHVIHKGEDHPYGYIGEDTALVLNTSVDSLSGEVYTSHISWNDLRKAEPGDLWEVGPINASTDEYSSSVIYESFVVTYKNDRIVTGVLTVITTGPVSWVIRPIVIKFIFKSN